MAGTARGGDPIAESAETRGRPPGAGKRQAGTGEQDLLGLASDVASDIAGTAKKQGWQLLETAKGEATGFVDARKNDAAESIAAIASSLRETGGGFDDRPNIQAFVGSAADGLEQIASGIRERSFADLYGEAESFARRQPVAVAAAAIVGGFLLARFIKSTAEDLADINAGATAARGRARAAARRDAV